MQEQNNTGTKVIGGLVAVVAIWGLWKVLQLADGPKKLDGIARKTTFKNGVHLVKSTYHDNDERYIIMDGKKPHLDSQPFFYDEAKTIADALAKVKSKRLKRK